MLQNFCTIVEIFKNYVVAYALFLWDKTNHQIWKKKNLNFVFLGSHFDFDFLLVASFNAVFSCLERVLKKLLIWNCFPKKKKQGCSHKIFLFPKTFPHNDTKKSPTKEINAWDTRHYFLQHQKKLKKITNWEHTYIRTYILGSKCVKTDGSQSGYWELGWMLRTRSIPLPVLRLGFWSF